MLAEIATRLGRYEDAEAVLIRCLELAPRLTPARHNLAIALYRQSKAARPGRRWRSCSRTIRAIPAIAISKAAALAQMGEYDQTIAVYETLLEEFTAQPKGWMSYGHALETVGRQADAIAAYRRP